MALMPSIMSLFGGGTSPASAAPVPATPAATNTTVPNANTLKSDGTVPAIPAAGVGDASPLGKYADLFQAPENTKQTTAATLIPAFNTDPAKIMEQAVKIDFTKHIPKDLIAKALGGDADAFLSVINQAAQFGFANNTMASAELVRGSFQNADGILRDRVLPDAMRTQNVRAAIQENNPLFSDPSVAPLMDTIRNQLQAKNPTSPPNQIATMAAEYFAELSQRVVEASGGTISRPDAKNNNNQFVLREPDWEQLLGVES